MLITLGALLGLVFAWLFSFAFGQLAGKLYDIETELLNAVGSLLMCAEFIVSGVVGGITGCCASTIGGALLALLMSNMLVLIVGILLVVLGVWIDDWPPQRQDILFNSPAHLVGVVEKVLHMDLKKLLRMEKRE